MKIPKNSQYVLFGGSFVLANKLQQVADKRIGGLTSKQWFLLKTLHDMPEDPVPTITTLAREADTSRQNVTKMLDVLCREGCVLLKENPGDQRSRTVEITESGRQMLVQMREGSGGFFEELFAGIGEKECEAAAGVLLKMIQNLYRMQEE